MLAPLDVPPVRSSRARVRPRESRRLRRRRTGRRSRPTCPPWSDASRCRSACAARRASGPARRPSGRPPALRRLRPHLRRELGAVTPTPARHPVSVPDHRRTKPGRLLRVSRTSSRRRPSPVGAAPDRREAPRRPQAPRIALTESAVAAGPLHGCLVRFPPAAATVEPASFPEKPPPVTPVGLVRRDLRMKPSWRPMPAPFSPMATSRPRRTMSKSSADGPDFKSAGSGRRTTGRSPPRPGMPRPRRWRGPPRRAR